MTDNLKTRIAEAMHYSYEEAALRHGWKTQESCRVPFAELPEANRLTMLDAAQAVLDIVEPMIPKWMPIESAPKDRDIQVCGFLRDGDDLMFQAVGQWDEDEQAFYIITYDYGEGGTKYLNAHGWMEVIEIPLPPAKE